MARVRAPELRGRGWLNTGGRTLRMADFVELVPPPGHQVDDRFGPPAQLLMSSTPEALLKDGAGRSAELSRTLVLDGSVGDGALHVAARAATCDETGGEGAACHLHQQDWGVPVRVSTDGVAVLTLPLASG